MQCICATEKEFNFIHKQVHSLWTDHQQKKNDPEWHRVIQCQRL